MQRVHLDTGIVASTNANTTDATQEAAGALGLPSGSLASAQEHVRTHSCPRARFQRISVCLVLSDSDSLSVFVQKELVGRACEEALAGAGAKMACWWDVGMNVHTMA